MFKKTLVAAALLCTLSMGNVIAASARAEITGFKIELIDMDASDGIAPSIAFAEEPWVQVFIGIYNRNNYFEDYSGSYGTLHGANGSGIAITSVLPDNGSSTVTAFTADSLAYSSGSQTMPFVLTPHTLALFGVEFAVGMDRKPGDTTFGLASLEADLVGGPRFSGLLRTGDGLHEAARRLFYGELLSGAAEEQGSFRLETVASALNAVAPVPEPGSWSLLTAGLAVLGGAQWRRRRGRRTGMSA